MKRPGGFDRGPEDTPEPVIDVRPEVSPDANQRPPRGRLLRPFFGADARHSADTQSSTDTPEIADQITEVIPDDALPIAADALHLADRESADPLGDLDHDVQFDSAPTGASIARAEGPGSVSRALAWAGIGAPRDPVQEADRRVRAAARLRRRRERRERRRFAGEIRRQRRGWFIAGGVVLALVAFIGVCVFTPLTAVREVRIEGIQSVTEADLLRALERFQGMPLAQVDDAQVHQALEVFPLIQRYQVERIPPHTLVVQIEERVPVIAIDAQGAIDLFDAAGVKVGSSEALPAGIPLATGAVTDLASPAFTAAAYVVRDLPQTLRDQIVAITATSAQDVTLTLNSGLQVVWGGEADTRRKAVVLQSMIAALVDHAVELIDVSAPDAPVFRAAAV